MDSALKTALIVIAMAVAIYFTLDHWQQGITIYATTCETGSGIQLPKDICKAVVRYRYWADD